MGPGPPRETCGPDELPLTWTLIGQPGTGILLKETLIMCSQASMGTKDTANLQKNVVFITVQLSKENFTHFALPLG